MSGVKICDLLWDCKDSAIISRGDVTKIEDIKIVPRKIIEMIIEKCKKNEEALRPYYGEPFEDGQDVAYTNIRVYAELLLKQFEEDDFSNTEFDAYAEYHTLYTQRLKEDK